MLLVSASDDHRDTQTKLDRSTAAVAQFQLRAEEGERRCRQLEDVRGTAVADTQEQVCGWGRAGHPHYASGHSSVSVCVCVGGCCRLGVCGWSDSDAVHEHLTCVAAVGEC